MSEGNQTVHHVNTCIIHLLQSEVVAGGDLMLKGEVSCENACDLRGRRLIITDQDSIMVQSLELSEFDGKANHTGELIIKAPKAVGGHTWCAILVDDDKGDIDHGEPSTQFSFTVRAHTTTTAVWGAPSAITTGATFGVNVGVKCTTECDLTGMKFGIYDHKQTLLAEEEFNGSIWAGTNALHFGTVSLRAPETDGYYRWEANVADSNLDIPHEGSSCSFGVQVVRSPDCLVRVSAIDKDEGTPIMGARVILHPFRAVTDEKGLAELWVPKGEYTFHVSGLKYAPFRATLQVTEATKRDIELVWQPDMDEYELSSIPEVREQIRRQRAKQEKQRLMMVKNGD